eukprot:TRINITY_DN2733_c0_g3_i1.p1 TRINITY_DN2733_c0_g3~~TRINITY_DN2733_c0_g3_i1.p1  ORF type:complete len:414 (+),score=84.76 TRINITY_DN2733_c0_g3_i1:29-1270(+)
MKIHVEHKDGKFDINMPPRSTIDDLKEEIQKLKGFDVDDMRLVHGKKVLSINELLESSGIKSGSTVKLSIVKGGAFADFAEPSSMGAQSWSSGLDANVGGAGMGMSGMGMTGMEIPGMRRGMEGMGGMGGYGMEGSSRGGREVLPEPAPPRVNPEITRKIERLVEMGFQADQAAVALEMAKGVVQVAASFLPYTKDEMKAFIVAEPTRVQRQPRSDSRSANAMIGGNFQPQRVPEDVIEEALADEPRDEILRKKLLEFAFDQKKKEALELIIKEIAPRFKTKDFLYELIEGALTNRKLIRKLSPDYRRIVKELRKEGYPDNYSISVLGQVNWNKNLALQILQKIGDRQGNITVRLSKPGRNMTGLSDNEEIVVISDENARVEEKEEARLTSELAGDEDTQQANIEKPKANLWD